MISSSRLRAAAKAASVLCFLGACADEAVESNAPVTPGGPDPVTCGVAAVNACAPADASPDHTSTEAGTATLVETRAGTALGTVAFSPNGRIQPRGRPTTYHFEYGKTAAYGSKTTPAALPPRLDAHYRETWHDRIAGWSGGLGGTGLKHVPTGGVETGFVRYAFPGDIDSNHADGIGVNELVQYMYPGVFDGSNVEWAAWGGGDPDLRGARVSAFVRGNAFVQKNSELVFWLQSTNNPATQYGPDARWSNWAFTGFNLTDALMAGGWQKVEYQLVNDTTQWTYAGHYVPAARSDYVYMPLDQVLGHLNGDFFHMLVLFDVSFEPEGSIDIDEVEVTYRNRSVLLASNGGRLVSSPAGGEDPARLVDGWRNGANKTWRSAANPQGPLEFVYELERPVTLEAVQLHQNPDWPSKDIEVLVSEDGVNFQLLSKDAIPATANAGANYAFFLGSPERVAAKQADGIPVLPWLTTKVKQVKVRVLSGYKPEYWGLGEIEVFGAGALMKTDDDWYSVTTDITGVTPGETYHYRLVAESDAGVVYGEDKTFTAPATNKPDVLTCAASRIKGATAKLEGRVNPLGIETQFYFEYGLDQSYGSRTGDKYSGLELTPRTVTDTVVDLEPGKTYHYRVVAVNATGTSYGEDTYFVAK